MCTFSQFLAQTVTLILLRIEVVDGLERESFTLRTLPLSIINNYQQQQRLNVDVVELQHLVTEREM
jgi:hypothetical protein